MRIVAGRHESRYRYSASLVYNNFPWLDIDAEHPAIETAAQKVLDVRRSFPNSTLATLYNPTTMPADLVKAHQALDRAVDSAYGYTERDDDDVNRAEFLFARFAEITSTGEN